jgi:two-component system cell cycle response regulator
MERDMENGPLHECHPRERRKHRRARVAHGAKIDFVRQPVTIDCRVRDLSRNGARLETEHAEYVPQTFEITVNGANEVYPAKRVWHDEGEIGVVFTSGRGD